MSTVKKIFFRFRNSILFIGPLKLQLIEAQLYFAFSYKSFLRIFSKFCSTEHIVCHYAYTWWVHYVHYGYIILFYLYHFLFIIRNFKIFKLNVCMVVIARLICQNMLNIFQMCVKDGSPLSLVSIRR